MSFQLVGLAVVIIAAIVILALLGHLTFGFQVH